MRFLHPKRFVAVALVLAISLVALPAKADTLDDRLRAIEARVQALEKASAYSKLNVPSLVEKGAPSVVSIYTVNKNDEVQAQGTGFITSSEGLILTNAHVVDDGNSIKVKLSTGKAFPAQLILFDPFMDIAILDIEGVGFTPLPWAEKSPVVGDPVVVIGNAYGYSNSVTFGIVSGIDRPDPYHTYHYPSLQTDAAINHGNSGGPLLNSSGEVVAIATWGELKGNTEGISFGIPIYRVKDALNRYDVKRGIVRPWLGISVQEPYWSRGGLPNDAGLMVTGISINGAASTSGLRLYDWITHVNGTKVNYLHELRQTLEKHKPGESVTLTIERKRSNNNGFEVLSLRASLGEYSVAVPAAIPSLYRTGTVDDIF